MERWKFAGGMELWADLGAGGDYQWLLCTTAWAPTLATDITRADIALYEPTDPSYAPQALTGGDRVLEVDRSALHYLADDPTFPLLAGGDPLGWLVVAADTGAPGTDTLLSAYRVVRRTDGTDAVFHLVNYLATFPAGITDP